MTTRTLSERRTGVGMTTRTLRERRTRNGYLLQ